LVVEQQIKTSLIFAILKEEKIIKMKGLGGECLFYPANINAGQSQCGKATFDVGKGWVNQSFSRKATFDTTLRNLHI